MPNKRDLRLDKYDIGVYAYRELNNFCKQYQEKKRKLQELECAYSAPRFDKAPGASCYDDDQRQPQKNMHCFSKQWWKTTPGIICEKSKR